MKKYIFVVLLCCFWGCYPGETKEKSLSGFVYWVIDGDTIKVINTHLQSETIRLYGIDCPEKDQDNGFWARIFTIKFCLFRKAAIEPVEKDRYDRLVAKIKVNGQDLSQSLVAQGYAWVYDHYCKQPYCRGLYKSETKARMEKRGLWADKDPIAPWKWRHGTRKPPWWKFW